MATTHFSGPLQVGGVEVVNSSGALTATSMAGPLTVATGPVTVTSGNLVLTSGNATLTSGNLLVTSGNITITSGNYVKDGVTLSTIKWVDVAVTAALLDGAGTVPVIVGGTGDQFKIREIILVGGGTNFGGAGDRAISLTDGTTVYTTIANADIESAPAASLRWGDTKVPFLTGTSNTATAAASTLRFEYSGGTTDHTTGSISFSVCVEKVA